MDQIWHYDGTSAIRHDGVLLADGDGFRLEGQGIDPTPHRWVDLTYGGEIRGAPYFVIANQRGWRIGFEGGISPDIAARLPRPEKYGRLIDRIGIGPATGVFLALSVAIVAISIKAPDFLAPLVPMSWEKKLGDAMVGDFGGRLCHGPGSDAALKAMVKRLDPKGSPIQIDVANIAMVNAVALPGGRIIIFRGLLQEAKSPDELAGVVGHEMGHVRNRDVMGALMRQLGLSVVMGGASGSTSQAGDYVNVLVSSTYSREAESKADDYSIRLMRTAKVSAADTAGFFARLAKAEEALGDSKSILGYIASHPMSAIREQKFRGSIDKGATYAPSLSPTEWRAIVDSCRNDPDVKKDEGFLPF